MSMEVPEFMLSLLSLSQERGVGGNLWPSDRLTRVVWRLLDPGTCLQNKNYIVWNLNWKLEASFYYLYSPESYCQFVTLWRKKNQWNLKQNKKNDLFMKKIIFIGEGHKLIKCWSFCQGLHVSMVSRKNYINLSFWPYSTVTDGTLEPSKDMLVS